MSPRRRLRSPRLINHPSLFEAINLPHPGIEPVHRLREIDIESNLCSAPPRFPPTAWCAAGFFGLHCCWGAWLAWAHQAVVEKA